MSTEYGRDTFGRALRLELRRAICSGRFWLGVGLMVLWLGFNAAQAVGSYSGAVFAGVPILIRLATNGKFSTGPVLLAIATIPYAFSYLTERECGFQQQAITRVGQQNYGICKAIAIFFSGFFMGATALIAFVILMSAIGIPHTVRYDEVKYSYAILAATMGPGWYYAVKLLHIGLVCGQAAGFSLLIMTWIPNAYVGFLSPLIGYYLYECILSLLSEVIYKPLLWRMVSADALLAGTTADDPLFNYLWTVSLLSVVALCFGMCFTSRLEKELAK